MTAPFCPLCHAWHLVERTRLVHAEGCAGADPESFTESLPLTGGST